MESHKINVHKIHIIYSHFGHTFWDVPFQKFLSTDGELIKLSRILLVSSAFRPHTSLYPRDELIRLSRWLRLCCRVAARIRTDEINQRCSGIILSVTLAASDLISIL